MNNDDKVRAELHWKFLEPLLKPDVPKEQVHYLYVESWQHSRKHAIDDMEKEAKKI